MMPNFIEESAADFIAAGGGSMKLIDACLHFQAVNDLITARLRRLSPYRAELDVDTVSSFESPLHLHLASYAIQQMALEAVS
jgi:hypothetical protein